MQQKTEEWLNAGAKLVWAVYPGTRRVVAAWSLAEMRTFTDADTIDAEPVLPGFTCHVADFF